MRFFKNRHVNGEDSSYLSGADFSGQTQLRMLFFGATDFQIQGGLQFLQILQVIFG
jgi:hypothetical protein